MYTFKKLHDWRIPRITTDRRRRLPGFRNARGQQTDDREREREREREKIEAVIMSLRLLGACKKLYATYVHAYTIKHPCSRYLMLHDVTTVCCWINFVIIFSSSSKANNSSSSSSSRGNQISLDQQLIKCIIERPREVGINSIVRSRSLCSTNNIRDLLNQPSKGLC